MPTLSRTYPLAEVGEAVRALQLGRSVGKTSVLCLAPSEGSGVADPAARERVGEARLRLVRDQLHALAPIDRLPRTTGLFWVTVDDSSPLQKFDG